MSFLKLFGNKVRKKDVYFQHSTEEKDTGEVWIDGKPIYTKTVQFTLSGTGVKTVAHGISDYSFIVDYKVICKYNTSHQYYKYPVVYYSNASTGTFYDSYFRIDSSNITFITNTDWSNHTFYATIYYTK